MDRHLPEAVTALPATRTTIPWRAAVTYWTAQWNPHHEAVSKEVAQLRAALSPASPVVCFGSAERCRVLPSERVLVLGRSRWLALRGLAPLIERLGDVTHVAGDASWHFLRTLGRRPLVLTLMIAGSLPDQALCDRVAVFAVESEPMAQRLAAHGVDPGRIRVVYPGVDLTRFAVRQLPRGPFRLVFASTPAHVEEFEARGIPLIIEFARRRPDIELQLLWRRWGDERTATAALQALSPPPNVRIEHGTLADIGEAYASAHATICCFAAGTGKACPNSVLEGLAVGRPTIVSADCDIAALVERTGAGVSADRNVEALSTALDRLLTSPSGYSERARALAASRFDLRTFLDEYRQLYRELSDRTPQTVLGGRGH